MRLTDAIEKQTCALTTSIDAKVDVQGYPESMPHRAPPKLTGDISELEKKLSSDGQVLYVGTPVYEQALDIGNLLYRFISPNIVVKALTIGDVQETVKFARRNNIRLTVKNGGHSYAGYCLNEGGIVLDMREMKAVSLNEPGMTATIQGGAIWKEAYAKLRNNHNGHIIIGGQCPSVGVSGFTLGGGLSPFSRSYGLGIDNLLEMTVVTAEGEVVKLSAEDPNEKVRELFWAVRGGGGGNFAITVEMKSRIHKLRDQKNFQVVCGALSWNLPQDRAKFNKAMDAFNNLECPDELTVDAIWHFAHDGQLKGEMTVIYNGTMDDCKKALAPVLDPAHGPTANGLKSMHWCEWMIVEEGFDKKDKVYHHHVSFIFADEAITPEVTNEINALMEQFAEFKHQGGLCDAHILWDHVGGATARVASKNTAYFWRDGHYVTTFKIKWALPEMEQSMLDFARHVTDRLARFAIQGKAAYLNYIDSTVEHWQESYYGDNYARLRKIKTDWDPKNFFRFKQSIEPLDVVSKPRKAGDTLQEWEKYQLWAPKLLWQANTAEEICITNDKLRREICGLEVTP
ncbi:hypothetical protein FRB94_005889 [Tulasnella sp. JGI-2019a]|nr:hypothetical protein FRB94_005889 [Tulasnella sp. JGI-2019a]